VSVHPTPAPTAEAPAPDAPSRGRRVAGRVLLALPTLAIAAFGGQLLVTGWADRSAGGGHQVQDLAWGALEALLLAVPLVLLIATPRRRPAAALQALAACAALLLVMVLTASPDPFTGVLVALVVAGVVVSGVPLRGRSSWHRPTALLAVVAAVPLVPYALDAAAAQRAGLGEHAELLGWTGAAAWALALVAVTASAALDRTGARAVALCAVGAAAVVATASLLHPDVPSSLGTAGGAGALAWAAALTGVTARRRTDG
jgi:hypothetical protein